MAVEQTELLPAMNGVERIVNVKHYPLGHASVGGAIEIDECSPHAQQRAEARPVLQARKGWLRSQIRIGRQNALRQFERRIAPQGGSIVAILIARSDHQQPEPDHPGKIVNDLRLGTRIVDTGRQSLGNTKTLFELLASISTPASDDN
jgi:hypothetical protein